eukprot:scaffold83334_cov72-Phaeocystis_antarctica.AAC.3
MLLLAKDGVYLPYAPRAIQQGILASGNRADVLINCPAGEDFIFASISNSTDPDVGGVNGTLLHITASASKSPAHNQSCDLPVFEVNRPCCDWPPFEPVAPTICTSAAICTSADASCFGRPRRPAQAGSGKEPDV